MIPVRLLSGIDELNAVALVLEGARAGKCLPAAVLALIFIRRTRHDRDLEHRALGVCTASDSRSVEIAVVALHQPGERIRAVATAETEEHCEAAARRDLEYGSSAACPATDSRSVEIAVAGLYQPCPRIRAIGEAETIERGETSDGGNLERCPTVVRSACVSRSVEIAIAALH